MRISSISNSYSYNNSRPSFQRLIINPSAQDIIDKMPEDERAEVNKIKSELDETQYWDLVLDGTTIYGMDRFYPYFINKQNPSVVHEYRLKAEKQLREYVDIYSFGISDDADREETIKFPTQDRAADMFNMLKRQQEEYSKRVYNAIPETPIQDLRDSAEQIKFLDEAYVYMNKEEKILLELYTV